MILPTYRRQDLLPRAIESVRAQSVDDWELLIVDDEPSDDTRAIVDGFDDRRIAYLRHDANRGLSAARNTGIRASSGEYVCFLDDDDEFAPEKLERQLEALQAEPDGDVALCWELELSGDGTERVRGIDLEGYILDRLLRADVVHIPTAMARRRVFDAVGLFDTALPHHEDFEMSLRLAARFRFVTVREPLLVLHTRHSELSRNIPNRVVALERIIATHPEIGRNRRVHSRWLDRLARHHAELGDRRRWRRCLMAALRRNPLNVRAALALLGGPAGHVRLSRARGQLTAAARRALRER